MRIHKNDTVQIRTGKDKGKTGKVLKVDLKNNSVLVDGINLYKKHSRPKRQGEKGEIVTISRPMDLSKVMLYCSNCKKGVRIGNRKEGEKAKARYCRKCNVTV
jgi:large subunit ribosomal protein L24